MPWRLWRKAEKEEAPETDDYDGVYDSWLHQSEEPHETEEEREASEKRIFRGFASVALGIISLIFIFLLKVGLQHSLQIYISYWVIVVLLVVCFVLLLQKTISGPRARDDENTLWWAPENIYGFDEPLEDHKKGGNEKWYERWWGPISNFDDVLTLLIVTAVLLISPAVLVDVLIALAPHTLMRSAAQVLSPPGLGILFILLGCGLFAFRAHQPMFYGCIEIIVGEATMFLGLTALNGIPSHDQATYLQIAGGLYIMVRGLDNVGKGLPNDSRFAWLWNLFFVPHKPTDSGPASTINPSP